MAEQVKCWHRKNGRPNCYCARFEDGSCVPDEVYPEYSQRRDDPARSRDDRSFADISNYNLSGYV